MEYCYHLIARGIFIDNHKLLLCRSYLKENYFLVGGHIEIGEDPSSALMREILEELHLEARIISFCGVLKNNWVENEKYNIEINFIFNIFIKDCISTLTPKSFDERIYFQWHDLEHIGRINLKPNKIFQYISLHLRKP